MGLNMIKSDANIGKDKKLIIIPAYNEAKNIENLIDKILSSANGFDYIIINDCSTDDTKRICEEKGFNYLGVSNTLVSLAVYYICIHAFKIDYKVGYVLGFLISAINAYYWNNKYVFKSNASKNAFDHIRAYFKLVMAYSFTFFLGFFLIWLWIEKLGINQSVAPLLNILITTPINFLMNKYWAFGEGKNGE